MRTRPSRFAAKALALSAACVLLASRCGGGLKTISKDGY